MAAATSAPPRLRRGLPIMAAVLAAALLFGLYRVALQRMVAHHLEAAAKLIPGCTGLVYDDLAIPLFSLGYRLEGLVLHFSDPRDALSVQTLHVHQFRPGRMLPRRVAATLSGVMLPIGHPLLAPLRHHARQMGDTVLEGDLAFRWSRRGAPEQENWAIDLTVTVADAGEASVELRLENVNPMAILLALEDPFNWLVALPAVRLRSAAFRFEDRGLWERFLAAAARVRGTRPQELRATLVQGFTTHARQARDPALKTFWQVLADFSRHPSVMTVQTGLAEPLPLGRMLWMRTPADIVRGLALTSRTESASDRKPQPRVIQKDRRLPAFAHPGDADGTNGACTNQGQGT